VNNPISRRRFLVAAAATGLMVRMPSLMAASGSEAGSASGGHAGTATGGGPLTKPIPATGEPMPVIGMGTWRTFNVGHDRELVNQRAEVLRIFFERGGSMVDGSPMYGTAEAVLGRAMAMLEAHDKLFSATKIWTSDDSAGREQAAQSRELWGVPRFDLLQIHNLVGWRGHLETLKQMKDDGEVRYIGITTSHGRRHGDVAAIMEREPMDFVQLSYDIGNRQAEERLLPLARERGIAVIANRPFDGGRLFDRYKNRPLPDWAEQVGCANWAEFFLKYIVSHPDITCAIPATTRREHMRENMGALHGRLPDPEQRERMASHIAGL